MKFIDVKKWNNKNFYFFSIYEEGMKSYFLSSQDFIEMKLKDYSAMSRDRRDQANSDRNGSGVGVEPRLRNGNPDDL